MIFKKGKVVKDEDPKSKIKRLIQEGALAPSNVIDFAAAAELRRVAAPVKKVASKRTLTINGNNNAAVMGDGNQVHITYRHAPAARPQITREPDEISNEQAAVIKKLVNDVARHANLTHARVYNALYDEVEATSYLKIKQNRFDEAALYLKKWLARFVKKNPPIDQEEYRKHLLKRIHAEARKRRDSLDQIRSYVSDRFGTNSLAELAPGQLNEVIKEFGL